MEFVGFEPGVVHANIHTKKKDKGDQLSIADASKAFHVYAMEWDAEKMDFFVDGRTSTSPTATRAAARAPGPMTRSNT